MIEKRCDIRPATVADVDFIVAANLAMAKETENRLLDKDVLEKGVSAVFSSPERARYFVAERAGKVVACLMITYEWSDWRNGSFWWIQSVYVMPDARRQGIFKQLYEHVAAQAKAAQAIGLRLYVECANTRAQQTYTSLGMQRCHYDMYETEF